LNGKKNTNKVRFYLGLKKHKVENKSKQKMDQQVRTAMLERFQYNPREGEEQVKRIFGLDDSDSVEYIENSLGFQSVCFRVHGERWGKGAFVKMIPPWDTMEWINDVRSSLISHAVRDAEEKGSTYDETRDVMNDIDDYLREFSFTSVKLQLKQEQRVSGILYERRYALPHDTLLVIPELYGIYNTRRTAAIRFELPPKALMYEDLTRIGFKPQRFDNPISDCDCIRVISALSDFHALLWRCREELGYETQRERFETEDSENSRNQFQRMISATIDKFSPEIRSMTYPYLEDICDGYVDRSITPLMMVHGDPWAQNVMLRRDENGEVDGVAFVDLGNVRVGNVIQDVCCFTTTLMDKIQAVWESLIDVYTERLGAQCPDLRDDVQQIFTTQAKRHGFASSLLYFNSDEPNSRQISAFGRARYSAMRFKEGRESDVENVDVIRRRRNIT
jgi:hypothetical protein